MDNIPEREQPKSERVISLGEEFPLFDPRYVDQDLSESLRVAVFDSRIALDIENYLKIPLDVYASASRTDKRNAITPFYPELGYHIDSEDLHLETRLEKMQRLENELKKEIDFQKAPLYLDIKKNEFDLNRLGFKKNKDICYLP